MGAEVYGKVVPVYARLDQIVEIHWLDVLGDQPTVVVQVTPPPEIVKKKSRKG